MRYRLSTLFLVIAIVGLILGWHLDRSRKPELLYLHLYSDRYDIYRMGDLPPTPREWQCLVSIAVTPGVPFDVDMPNHYEPTMRLSGKIEFDGKLVSPNFVIEMSDPGLGLIHRQTSPVEIGKEYNFEGEQFRFSFSKSELPK